MGYLCEATQGSKPTLLCPRASQTCCTGSSVRCSTCPAIIVTGPPSCWLSLFAAHICSAISANGLLASTPVNSTPANGQYLDHARCLACSLLLACPSIHDAAAMAVKGCRLLDLGCLDPAKAPEARIAVP